MNRRRSERALLQIRLIVEAEIEPGNPVRVESFTLVVNAHGGLLEMSMKISKGQKLLLRNPSAGLEETARVVAVRAAQDGNFTIAFEFDNPTPQFWPISFPPKNWSLVQSES